MPEPRYSNWPRVLFAVLTAAVVAVYAYAASGPLRAVTSTVSDTTGYVGLTAWILDGRPADMHEVPWRCREFPVGYPCAIAALYKCGLATPHGLLALNFLSLAIGLWASWILLRRAWNLPTEAAWAVLLLVAASTVCGELSVSIASEMLFFAASTAALAVNEGRGKRARTADARSDEGVAPNSTSPPPPPPAPAPGHPRFAGTASLVLAAVAISVRTAGIALVLAVIWSLLRHPVVWHPIVRHPFVRRIGLRRVLAVAALPAAVVAWFVVARILRSEYVANIMAGRYASGAAWDVVAGQQLAKLSAFGELFTNLRAEDFRAVYRADFIFAGGLCLAVLVAGFVSRRRHFTPLDAYVATYAAMLFVYPYFSYGSSRRFWFPVLPFLFGLAYTAAEKLFEKLREKLFEKSPATRRFGRPLLAVCLTAFVLWGCVRSIELSRFARDTDHEAAAALIALSDRR